MRSYFCKKCDLEFDLEEEMETDPSAEEPVSMVFCPNCLVTVAEALPETPERILARERRIRHQEKLRRRKSLKILLAGAGMLFLASAGFSLAYHSFFWMLVLSLFPGITAGAGIRIVHLQSARTVTCHCRAGRRANRRQSDRARLNFPEYRSIFPPDRW